MPTNINGKKYYSIDEMNARVHKHIDKEVKRLANALRKDANKIYVSNLTIEEKLKYHWKYVFYEVMSDNSNRLIHSCDNFTEFDEQLIAWMEKNWYWVFSENKLDKKRYRMENV